MSVEANSDMHDSYQYGENVYEQVEEQEVFTGENDVTEPVSETVNNSCDSYYCASQMGGNILTDSMIQNYSNDYSHASFVLPNQRETWDFVDYVPRETPRPPLRNKKIFKNVNGFGFHGDLAASATKESILFKSKHVTTGINFDNYDSIPVEIGGENVPEPMTSFSTKLFPASLLRNIKLCLYQKPTPVQKYASPVCFENRDLMACAQTGSGKTAGFLLPLISCMLRDGARHLTKPDRSIFYPTTLILAPTRELAIQIHYESQRFCYCTGVSSACVYGGTSYGDTMRSLRNGCDILVGTPGRVSDLIDKGTISFIGITHLVLDEADRMLDMGFEPQIRNIVQQWDMSKDRQTMMFSATFPSEIQKLASDFMSDYVFLTVGRVGGAASDIEQRILWVNSRDKEKVLLEHLSDCVDNRVLVFVQTKVMADSLGLILKSNQIESSVIHGDRTQQERERSLIQFRLKRINVLVATDVAARGLDIPDVSYVINYDTPMNIDDYVHRIGRTGRAGNTGIAISFVNRINQPIAQDLIDILQETNQKVPDFLSNLVTGDFSSGSRGNRGGRGRGGFGGRDYRSKNTQMTIHHNTSSDDVQQDNETYGGWRSQDSHQQKKNSQNDSQGSSGWR